VACTNPGAIHHGDEGIALNLDEQQRRVADLGPSAKAMILRNHGLLAMGESAAVAFDVMYYLEAACQIQVDALSAGKEGVMTISDEIGAVAAGQFERPGGTRMQLTWEACLRELAHDGCSFAD